MSGGVDADDALVDYIWCETTSGERHLFEILTFTGGVSTCTAVTTTESVGATFSGADWHINGTRKSFDVDSSNSDENDWNVGWQIELASGVYTHSTHFTPGQNTVFSSLSPGIEVYAAAGSSTRPQIQVDGNIKHFEGRQFCLVKFTFIEFNRPSSSNGGSNNYFDTSQGCNANLMDCVIDNSMGSATQPSQLISVQYGRRVLTAVNCYFRGGADRICRINQCEAVKFYSCHFDGDDGTYGSVAAVGATNGTNDNVEIVNCLIEAPGGAGFFTPTDNDDASVTIMNNTFVDCGGNAVEFEDSAGSSDNSPTRSVVILNNLVAYSGGYAFVTPTTATGRLRMEGGSIFAGNATYSNTSGAYTGQITSGTSDVALTADPFVDRPGRDYSLNTTSGGGADCTDAAYPSTLPTP